MWIFREQIGNPEHEWVELRFVGQLLSQYSRYQGVRESALWKWSWNALRTSLEDALALVIVCWNIKVQGMHWCFSEESKTLNKSLLDCHCLCPYYPINAIFVSFDTVSPASSHQEIVIKSNFKNVIPFGKERRKGKERRGREEGNRAWVIISAVRLHFWSFPD